MTDTETPWWRSTWPLDRRVLLELAVALVGVVAPFSLVGFVLFDWTAPNALTDLDRSIADWFVDARTPGRDRAADLAALLADTPVKIGLSVVVAAAMLYRWRRWYEAALVGVTLAFEATAYVLTSYIVDRPRPDVPQLIESPVDNTYPSGHVAAATVYGAFVIIVFLHTRNVAARTAALVLGVLVAVAVGVARIHQGMHYLSDVVAGVILGLVSLAIGWRILGPPPEDAAVDEAQRKESV